jgi:hypothetical protein
MATLSLAARNAALDAIVTLLSSPNTGHLFLDAGSSALTDSQFGNWGAASGGSVSGPVPLTFTQATGTGTAAFLQIFRAGFFATNVIATVGGPGSGADIELSPNANIITNIRVVLNSLTMSIA